MLQRLDQLYKTIKSLGLNSHANKVLDVIKFAQASGTYTVVSGDVPGKIVKSEEVGYTSESYTYNGQAVSGCLNLSGLGSALMMFNETSATSLQLGQKLNIPSLQLLIDNYNSSHQIIQTTCLEARRWSSYIDSAISQEQCSRDTVTPDGENLNPDWTPESGEDTRQLPALITCIAAAIDMNDSDKELFRRLVWRESRNDGQAARSSVNAIGYSQLINGHEQVANIAGIDISSFDITNSEFDNLLFGALYLKWLLERYSNDRHKALAAYNWGFGNLDDALGGDRSKDISNWFDGPSLEENRRVVPSIPSKFRDETYGYVREILGIS